MLSDRATREFHISRKSRDRYEFDESLFSITGNVVFANPRAARLFAQKMNGARDLIRFPEQTVKAGEINAMGLIDEILHYVVLMYRQQKNGEVMAQALRWLDDKLGASAVDATLARFADEFPTVPVYRGRIPLAEYLEGQTAGTPNRQIVLEELMMLWLANMNPAFSPFVELFDDTPLKGTAYLDLVSSLHDFFETQPRYGPDHQNLVDMLRSPAIAAPHSLSGQLQYILSRWGYLLGAYVSRILTSLDFIKEEERASFLGPGPALVPIYGYAAELEPERFTLDREWMPELVLMAKHTYVWLDQLSKQYGRSFTRLDQIPDAELDRLARWGITGLWLIGLWERSPASRKIKQMMGNPEAAASAYSIMEYRIAGDLGGEGALQDLKERAWKRGIRLASDMVPNHMAIDSTWVMQHPERFISLDYSPYPSYTFGGPDLSGDPRVGIFIEDHYYNHTDAAVVFKRVDRWTGTEKYIYHGNDGTSTPWNDTAQLNYLEPEVREEVIQTILRVARQFPIIRFDAAMTLAKKHYERLWFPEPGTGGAIPSRAEHGMSKAEFDARMPEEFWREVVDRIAAEAPDTLLLAEAFWLMEGYFVRTLGMHRVYNSAFMNMLRDEDNAKYRSVMKNTLEFDPEILRRYVNFMNNPDERTAVDQFGKGDKYMGVCTMMVTLPGLPMFGHGQIEGYTEKYGMEYQRAYWNEQPDAELVRRHEAEIFPLLRRRYLFAGVDSFLLFDFFTPEGYVNEDVFAYSNRFGSERALVVYHNKYAQARGWIRTSAAFSSKDSQGDERRLVQRSLGEGWGLHPEQDYFTIFRDQVSGLQYIRSSNELFSQGLYVELQAYQRHVFLDVREVKDTEEHAWAQLTMHLNGRGVPSVDEALREMTLQPIHSPFRQLVNSDMFQRLWQARVIDEGEPEASLLDEVEQKMARLLQAAEDFTSGTGNVAALAHATRVELKAALQLPVLVSRSQAARQRKLRGASEFLGLHMDDPREWDTLFGWLFVHPLGQVVNAAEAADRSRALIDEWLLGRILADTLRERGADAEAAWRAVAAIKLLTAHDHWYRIQTVRLNHVYPLLESLFRDADARYCLGVNRFDGVLWFNREAYDQLLWRLLAAAVIQIRSAGLARATAVREQSAALAIIEKLQEVETASRFRVEDLLAAARQLDAPKRPARSARRGIPRRRTRAQKA
jgi:glycosidase